MNELTTTQTSINYQTFSDIFEEEGFLSKTFHEGFGMLNVQGIAKPVYRAFELLHRTGFDRNVVDTTVTSNATTGNHKKQNHHIYSSSYSSVCYIEYVISEKTRLNIYPYPIVKGVYVITNRQKNDEIMAIIYNHNIPQAPIKTETICIQFNGLNLAGRRALLERIDDEHSNPVALWEQMGNPEYPTQAQVIQSLISTYS